MTKLTDIQLILLSTASVREDGSLLPPPENLGDAAQRIRRAITQLIKQALAAEADVSNDTQVLRTDGDRKIGVIITDAGREAIGAVEAAGEEVAKASVQEVQPPAKGFTPRAGSKQALLVDLLKRDNGASLTEMTEGLSWLPHTTRAAMTGLRKRGLTITNEKVDGTTRYKIVEAA